jgi:hypothetical protein
VKKQIYKIIFFPLFLGLITPGFFSVNYYDSGYLPPQGNFNETFLKVKRDFYSADVVITSAGQDLASEVGVYNHPLFASCSREVKNDNFLPQNPSSLNLNQPSECFTINLAQSNVSGEIAVSEVIQKYIPIKVVHNIKLRIFGNLRSIPEGPNDYIINIGLNFLPNSDNDGYIVNQASSHRTSGQETLSQIFVSRFEVLRC